MDVTTLPHFNSTAAPNPLLARGTPSGGAPDGSAPACSSDVGGAKRRPPGRSDTLQYPHAAAAVPPSYIEEVNDLKSLLGKTLKE